MSGLVQRLFGSDLGDRAKDYAGRVVTGDTGPTGGPLRGLGLGAALARLRLLGDAEDNVNRAITGGARALEGAAQEGVTGAAGGLADRLGLQGPLRGAIGQVAPDVALRALLAMTPAGPVAPLTGRLVGSGGEMNTQSLAGYRGGQGPLVDRLRAANEAGARNHAFEQFVANQAADPLNYLGMGAGAAEKVGLGGLARGLRLVDRAQGLPLEAAFRAGPPVLRAVDRVALRGLGGKVAEAAGGKLGQLATSGIRSARDSRGVRAFLDQLEREAQAGGGGLAPAAPAPPAFPTAPEALPGRYVPRALPASAPAPALPPFRPPPAPYAPRALPTAPEAPTPAAPSAARLRVNAALRKAGAEGLIGAVGGGVAGGGLEQAKHQDEQGNWVDFLGQPTSAPDVLGGAAKGALFGGLGGAVTGGARGLFPDGGGGRMGAGLAPESPELSRLPKLTVDPGQIRGDQQIVGFPRNRTDLGGTYAHPADLQAALDEVMPDVFPSGPSLNAGIDPERVGASLGALARGIKVPKPGTKAAKLAEEKAARQEALQHGVGPRAFGFQGDVAKDRPKLLERGDELLAALRRQQTGEGSGFPADPRIPAEVVGAARMFARPDQFVGPQTLNRAGWMAEMAKDYPNIAARPGALEQVFDESAKLYAESAAKIVDKTMMPSVTRLADLLQRGLAREPRALDWYETTIEELIPVFGQDTPVFIEFLAATSPNNNVPGNVEAALKAYTEWKMGYQVGELWGDAAHTIGINKKGERYFAHPGYLPAHIGNLQKAFAGEVWGDIKVQDFTNSFYEAYHERHPDADFQVVYPGGGAARRPGAWQRFLDIMKAFPHATAFTNDVWNIRGKGWVNTPEGQEWAETLQNLVDDEGAKPVFRAAARTVQKMIEENPTADYATAWTPRLREVGMGIEALTAGGALGDKGMRGGRQYLLVKSLGQELATEMTNRNLAKGMSPEAARVTPRQAQAGIWFAAKSLWEDLGYIDRNEATEGGPFTDYVLPKMQAAAGQAVATGQEFLGPNVARAHRERVGEIYGTSAEEALKAALPTAKPGQRGAIAEMVRPMIMGEVGDIPNFGPASNNPAMLGVPETRPAQFDITMPRRFRGAFDRYLPGLVGDQGPEAYLARAYPEYSKYWLPTEIVPGTIQAGERHFTEDLSHDEQREYARAAGKVLLPQLKAMGALFDLTVALESGPRSGGYRGVAQGFLPLRLTVRGKVGPEVDRRVEGFAGMVGLGADQANMAYHRPVPYNTPTATAGIDITLAAPLTGEQAAALADGLKDMGYSDGFMQLDPTTIRFVDYQGYGPDEYYARVRNALNDATIEQTGRIPVDVSGDMLGKEDYRGRVDAGILGARGGTGEGGRGELPDVQPGGIGADVDDHIRRLADLIAQHDADFQANLLPRYRKGRENAAKRAAKLAAQPPPDGGGGMDLGAGISPQQVGAGLGALARGIKGALPQPGGTAATVLGTAVERGKADQVAANALTGSQGWFPGRGQWGPLWRKQTVESPKNIAGDEGWGRLVLRALQGGTVGELAPLRDAAAAVMHETDPWQRLPAQVQQLRASIGKGGTAPDNLGQSLAQSTRTGGDLSTLQQATGHAVLNLLNPAGMAQTIGGAAVAGGVGAARPFLSGVFKTVNDFQQETFRQVAYADELGQNLERAAAEFLPRLQAAGYNVAGLPATGQFDETAVNALAGPHAANLWKAVSDRADDQAQARVRFLFGDYGKQGALEKKLGGPVPFMSWLIRAYPVAIAMALQHPVVALGLYQIMRATSQGAGEGGRPDYTAGQIPVPTDTPFVGPLLERLVPGGNGTVYLDPVGAISPVGGELFQSGEQDPDANWYQQGTSLLSRAGLPGVNPAIKAGAYVAGLDYKTPGALSRTAGLENALGLLPEGVNPRLPNTGPELLAGARRAISPAIGPALGGEADPNAQAFDPIKRRYAELVQERTRKPLRDPSNRQLLLEMADPDSPLMAEARRQVLQAGAAKAAVSFTSPVAAIAQGDTPKRYLAARQAVPFSPAKLALAAQRPELARPMLSANAAYQAQTPALGIYQGSTAGQRTALLDEQFDARNARLKRTAPQTLALRRAQDKLTRWEVEKRALQRTNYAEYLRQRDQFLAKLAGD